MDSENKRRSFLKHLLSLMAFSAGSILSINRNRASKIGNLSPTKSHAMGSSNKRIKKIGVEEHMMPPGQFDQIEGQIEGRLKDMDEGGIDMQVLSCIFPIDESQDASEATSMAKNANNNLAKIVEKYPERFASFAAIALQDPDAAARELERAVKELGLKGTMIFLPIKEGLDNKKFWVIFEKAEELDMPIYVHPGPPSSDMIKPYLTYPILKDALLGYAAEGSLQAMRLIFSGVFDKYPNLKIILGHMGEGIPYWLWRIDNRWSKDKDSEIYKTDTYIELKRTPSQYFKENFYITTSGMFWPLALQFVNLALGSDRILFAVDYPPESNKEAVQFIESTPISDIDKEKICHLNAEKLLRI